MKVLDRVSIDNLLIDYGSPLYVVSAQALKNNVRKFKALFSKKYLNTVIAYAYKANCLPGLLDIIHKEGAWAEVASGFEYEIARAIGVPGRCIVFNGPYKRKEELKRAVLEGALINVDNTGELNQLMDISSQLGKSIEIGIRINTDLGINQLPDRFGFNLESGEALEIVSLCVKHKMLNVVGLHIHLASYIVEPDGHKKLNPAKSIKLIWPKSFNLYKTASERITRFADEVEKRFGTAIKYINMGGGFPTIDGLKPYLGAIAEPIKDWFSKDGPVLILEPGRALVKNAMHLITTIVDVREIDEERRRIVVDAGTNLLPTSLWSSHEIEYLEDSNMNQKETIVYGPLCLQTDILGITRLPQQQVGERLIIKDVGAYNFSQSSSFIFPRPTVLLIDGDRVKVLRRKEAVEDIVLSENNTF
jgi:diaminopimelate decarboxylase